MFHLYHLSSWLNLPLYNNVSTYVFIADNYVPKRKRTIFFISKESRRSGD